MFAPEAISETESPLEETMLTGGSLSSTPAGGQNISKSGPMISLVKLKSLLFYFNFHSF